MNNNIHSIKPEWHQLGVGPGPDFLDEASKRAWDDLVSMAPPGEWLSLFHAGVACMAVLVAKCRAGTNTNEDTDVLTEWMADYLLGPVHFEKLVGVAYLKPWPNANE